MIRRYLCLSAALLALSTLRHARADETDTSNLSTIEILLRVYDATRGLRWTDHTNWLQTDNHCGWHGISCYDSSDGTQRDGQIKGIDLADNHLVGSIPKEIFDLPFLKSLILRDNADLTIRFDNIESSQELRYLIISNTLVETLDNLDNAPTLAQLHITNLQLKGDIPTQIFKLTALKGLYANFNSLSGSISTQIGALTNLQELYIYENDLTGQLPTQIGYLTELRIAALAQNAFSGTLPTELNMLTNLEILALQRDVDNPKGSGIGGTLPPLDQLSQITELYFENQMLSGSIPEQFLNNAPNDEMIKINLSNNTLTGLVPMSLTHLSRLSLFLTNNMIKEVSGEMCNSIGGWIGGSVADLGCEAFLCPPGKYASNGRKTEDENCEVCANAEYAGTTDCPESSSGTVVDEREVLVSVYNACGGRFWKKNDNWLNPSVDICKWYGISCTGDNVTEITLNNNDLINTPPQDLFTLPELKIINFNSNNIDFKFAGISSASNLEHLDLTHTDLTSLNEIQELDSTKIKYLKLASNDLTGPFPTELFLLATLNELTLSHNKFSGTLPKEISNLVALIRFECYGNKLNGQLPSELGTLTVLTELSIAENSFTGTLPSELNTMAALKILSIHQSTTPDGIGGHIRPYRHLGQLMTIHLNDNKFIGTLPMDFLETTTQSPDRIEIKLGNNFLTGSLPSSWSDRFVNLLLDLTGNKMTDIADAICERDIWMDGAVAEYQCAAILCPIGTFNDFGRQTDVDSACRPCIENRFLGAKSCNGEGIVQDLTEEDILKELFYTTGGNSWARKEGWINTANHCNWNGISCNIDGLIVKIDLNKNGLTGTPPKSIFKLKNLNALDLRSNQINFHFDGIGESALDSLFLSDTDLNTVEGIGAAKSLTVLHLTDNDLTGTIPAELFGLTNLKQLFLSYNRFSGRLPQAISSWVNLQELYIIHNRLTGQIPAAIGSLQKLKILALTENLFSGTLPAELNDLIDIEIISIQREGGIGSSVDPQKTDGKVIQNTRQGLGIRGPLPSFDKLTTLKQLYLGVNSLTGTIPYNFLDSIADKSQQIDIDLISNSLTGKIPASLIQFDKLALYLAGNKAIDEIAVGICAQKEWMTGDVEKFGCHGFLCPLGTTSRYGRQHDNDSKCMPCPDGKTTPSFGSFECINATAGGEDDERAILTDFFLEMDGYNWAVQTHWLEPTKSVCDWYGITCISDSKESVSAIVLPRNRLNGTIPSTIYKLAHLNEINFSFNSVRIDFNNISNARELEYINFDGMDFIELKGIEATHSTLKFLHIGKNSFDSTFPSEIPKLSNLQSLYMSDNDFSSEFPSDLKELRNLVSLSCAHCGLESTLPIWLGLLTNLQYLSLEDNSFTGSLPSSLGNLTHLKHLDLSDQSGSEKGIGLSGELLDFAGMANLTELYLYRNAFNGTIPLNFLLNVKSSDLITVDLRINMLTGSIPLNMSKRTTDFNFYLANNEINSIPTEICEQKWNDVNASGLDCNHILCANGTYNRLGRATADTPCEVCSDNNYTLFFGSTQCNPEIERKILEEMYKELNGNDWTNNDGWRDEDNKDICTWHGVTCHDENPHVQSIVLEENNMVGTLPSAIFELIYMETLDLKKNNITVSSFSGIDNAKKLESLTLSQTTVNSLDGIGKAPVLQSLHLTAAQISGKIPEEISYLLSLKQLYLNYNQLSGAFPTEIGLLTNLQELFLFHNNLQGSIPSEIGKLSNMEVLGLGENDFSGSLPKEINFLTNIKVLSLQRESGTSVDKDTSTGSYDKGLVGNVLPFNKMPFLRELYLSANHFEGSLPSDFLLGIANTSAPLRVDLTSNQITGVVPSGLARFDDLNIFLAGNAITGIPDELCFKSESMDGETGNGCDAILCRPGFFNTYGRQVSDDDTCVFCAFNSSSQFFGSMSCGASDGGIMDERTILFHFYNELGGDDWSNKDGWKEDNESICKWHGITCSSDSESVISVALPSNGLIGTIPAVLFHLPHLKKLNLNDNPLYVSFEGIELEPALEELSLDETSISTLKGIAQLKNLRILRIDNINFGGQDIPIELFSLSKLEELYMSNSEFGGKLPSKIGNLSSLQKFYCMKNDITGEIPTQIGSLANLKFLDLSENEIFGTLPSALNDLSSLQVLFINSFTRNGAGITGPLLSFSKMTDLRELSLGANTLTGSIPLDFLSGIAVINEDVTIILNSNRLTGVVPGQLERFQKLNIDLAGNRIAAIEKSLCSKSLWMNGAVGSFGCNGILCEPKTFNQQGRQSSADSPCQPCNDVEQGDQLGSILCIPLQKDAERKILELLYQMTDGPKWIKHDHWLDPNIDICDWFGISCRARQTVESLLLGSNNLAGTVPKEIFDLPNLTFLWLYSNPIKFSFDSIGNAKNLMSILLDSTNLKTLDGVGKATALESLDVRFNNIQGTLTTELQELKKLVSFSSSNNKLSGTIPNFSKNRKLNTLRLENNMLTGTLPTFASNTELTALDLSGNLLTGSISSNFLVSSDPSTKITVDVSKNKLSGSVPGELARFDKVTIYLRDNELTGIESALCQKSEWNDGDVGSYKCDGIMCAPGFFSNSTGRASKDVSTSCAACENAMFYGVSCCGFCDVTSSSKGITLITSVLFGVVAGVVLS